MADVQPTVSAPQAAPVHLNGVTPPPAQTQTATKTENVPRGTSTQQPSDSPNEMFDVKVNGKIVKMSRQELLDNASMAYMANNKFNEAAKMRKEVEERTKSFRENPLSAFEEFAKELDPEKRRALIEDYYSKNYIEPETLTPEQKKLKELEEYRNKTEQEKKQAEEQAQKEQFEKLVAQQTDYLNNKIVSIMDEFKMPRSKFLAERVAFYMRQNLQNGWDAPNEMIARQVMQEREQLWSDIKGAANAEQLVSLLGEDVVKTLQKHAINELKARRQKQTESFSNSGSSGRGGSSRKDETIGYDEVNRRLRNLRRFGKADA